jgi:hypothetical protein
MIIRNKNGDLVKINRYDYTNDLIYYEKIMNIKKEFTKERECDNINNLNKPSNFFIPKKVNKPRSSSLMSICNFVNIEL